MLSRATKYRLLLSIVCGVFSIGVSSTQRQTTTLDIHWQGSGELPSPIYHWLRRNTAAAKQLIGHFPNSIGIEIVSVPGNFQPWESPVPYGEVIRTLPEAIRFHVYPKASLEALLNDWTAAHEFSHLFLPYLGYSNRWISEGFASYYQNILMTKMGYYSPEKAWRKLLAGINRAKLESPEITPAESPYVGMRRARMMIYWAGAAMALEVDVHIRASTQHKQNLNTVLGDLQRCCLPTLDTWSAEKLFTQLDQFLPSPIFVDLWKKLAFQKGAPNIDRTLEKLGLNHKGEVIHFDSPYQKSRQDIMKPFGTSRSDD